MQRGSAIEVGAWTGGTEPILVPGSFPRGMNARLPFRVSPMVVLPVKEPFDRPGWVYEEKYDGERILAYTEGPKVQLLARIGKEKAKQFPSVARAVGKLSPYPIEK